MKKTAIRLVICASVWLGSVATGLGQQFTGGIRGAVRDAVGVIPGATVILINEGTTVGRETVTNATGEYAFPSVPPATYTIRASFPGYKTQEQRGVALGTQEFLTMDFLLDVGQVDETITVTADASLIETANASTGADIDREMMDTLPTHGRNAFLMAITIPTVVTLNDPAFDRQQDLDNTSNISMGGGGVRANNYLLDGVPITDLKGRAIANPSIETLGDVKVQVHTFDAEMGRTGGGVFNSTARSGTNKFHGSGFYQIRPIWGQSLDFFSDVAGASKEDTGLADSFYGLYGVGGGGPIVRNRTFFWTATEGYRQRGVFSSRQLWPTARQKIGDFSLTTDGGSRVRLWNPYCRGGTASARCPATGPSGTLEHPEFVNAIIPEFVQNPVARNIVALWPLPNQNNEDTDANNVVTTEFIDRAFMATLKVEHKLTDRWSLSGMYLYNRTAEPFGRVMPQPIADAIDLGAVTLRRRPQVLVLNSTNILTDTTVLTLRYGWTTFPDGGDGGQFPPGVASLGFSSTFVDAIHPDGRTLFPGLQFTNYEAIGRASGAERRWKQPYAINIALSKLIGNHTIKIGGDLRRLGVTERTERSLAGSFDFDGNFTQGPNGEGGYDFASFLVGAPSATSFVPANPGPIDVFTRYYAGYVQDDWRVTSRLTLNYGVRLEREDGLREVDDRFTVAFDQNAVSPLDALVPASARQGTPLEGQTITGGLVFAGVDGAPTHQGDPPAIKVSPRLGVAYSLNSQTVVRGGYGIFWAPWNYDSTQHGQIGFTRNTFLTQGSDSQEAPLTTLDNPFPNGLQAPFGSSLGLLTGMGATINFVDQTKGAPRVHQISVDVQRELPGDMAVTIGYAGAMGDELGYGGTTDAVININQIPPEVALAAAPASDGRWDPTFLRASIPNPFFGIPEAGEFGESPTIQRGQLLRPFPQFRDVNQRQTTAGGKRRYHALVVKLDKRTTNWWGGRMSYTLSTTDDNQFGQARVGATREALPQNNYDLAAEYGTSLIDSPHRLILAPLVRIPGPADTGKLASILLSGWTASAIASFTSGAPATAYLSRATSEPNLGLFGGLQRPDPTGVPLATAGSDTDRVASAEHPEARWFDPAAFQSPGTGRFGTNPRTDTRGRFQFWKNLDLVFAKNTPVGIAGATAQVRIEILNATNTPNFAGAPAFVDLSSYGRIDSQVGFSRVWQFSFRVTF